MDENVEKKPSKSAERLKAKREFQFRHFAMRLLERYNILINYETYCELCEFPFIRDQVNLEKDLGTHISHRIAGWVYIDDTPVSVIRMGRKPHLFITAMPPKTKHIDITNKPKREPKTEEQWDMEDS